MGFFDSIKNMFGGNKNEGHDVNSATGQPSNSVQPPIAGQDPTQTPTQTPSAPAPPVNGNQTPSSGPITPQVPPAGAPNQPQQPTQANQPQSTDNTLPPANNL